MRATSLVTIGIIAAALFANRDFADATSQIANKSSNRKSVIASSAKNSIADKKSKNYWMTKMGSMENDLINVQAVVVKDEDVKATCDPAERKSKKRYIMCAGSILNRNHVLTSATCLHDATHIRHNIRAPLAVVIAPLKPSIQVIGVREYQIHPHHHTNPYARQHLRHNVAILKLACRINMENLHKIEFPRSPMIKTCSEENCVVAAYRKTGKTSNVMFQMFAPDMPYPNRRRKETSFKDVEPRTPMSNDNGDIIVDPIVTRRSKRKLAEPPKFVGKYKFVEKIIDDVASINSTTLSSINVDLTFPGETSLHDDVSKALRRSGIVNETVKSHVVRSSPNRRTCALTGAPVLLNRTQAALVAVPCDGRQSASTWHYTDLFDNLEWIHDVLQDLDVLTHFTESPGGTQTTEHPISGNHSGCSTCIFNFFIEIGCKDKNQCGKNYTNAAHSQYLPVREITKISSNPEETRRTNQDCSVANTIGNTPIRGCDKSGKKSFDTGERRNSIGNEKNKQRASISDPTNYEIGQRSDKSVTDRSIGNPRADRTVDDEKIVKSYEKTMKENNNGDRVANEIGLQNIDGESADFLSEVEKGLDINSGVKRDLGKSRRFNV